jgi:hypothetical protein
MGLAWRTLVDEIQFDCTQHAYTMMSGLTSGRLRELRSARMDPGARIPLAAQGRVRALQLPRVLQDCELVVAWSGHPGRLDGGALHSSTSYINLSHFVTGTTQRIPQTVVRLR